MPIVGLTDRLPSFPQIGCIRKGGPKAKDRPGKDLTYLRVEFDEQEKDTAERFRSIYGEEPQEINILLPFDEVDRCWEAWREAYVAGALVHRCDGEYINYAISAQSGEVLVRDGRLLGDMNGYKAGDRVPCSGKAGCLPHGRLRVIVPELRRLAYLMVLTGSIHDIVNITAQVKGVWRLNNWKLRGIPLVLRRRPKRISTPSGEGGKRARREKWLLSIEADPQWVEAKILELRALATPRFALPRGDALELEETEPEEEPFEEPAEGEVTELPAEEPAEPERTEADFLEDVCSAVIVKGEYYFRHALHVTNTLKQLGLSWSVEREPVLMEALWEHAQKRSGLTPRSPAQDGQQEMFEPEEDPMPF